MVLNLLWGGWCLQQAALLGVLSFFMAWVVQAFFAAVLLDIVDAVFICYAVDKDTQSVTRLEVHEVFSQVLPPFPLLSLIPLNIVSTVHCF